MPKVSICIPAFNQTRYLCKTLDSILIQSFEDYEIIITDDSPNNIVKNLVDQYNFNGKLRYYKNEIALGSPANWNSCMSMAQGDYIKIMHHDDWFGNSNSLQKLVSLLETGNNFFAFCGCNNISPNEVNLFHHSINESQAAIIKSYPEFLFCTNGIGAPSVTIFKKNSVIFDENIKYLVDIDFYIQLLKMNNKFSYTQEALVNIGHNEGQVTNTVINDKQLLVFEYSYVYKKLNFTKNTFRWGYDALWNLLARLNIQSLKELKELGWYDKIPPFVDLIIFATKFIKKAHANKLHKVIKNLVFKYSKLT